MLRPPLSAIEVFRSAAEWLAVGILLGSKWWGGVALGALAFTLLIATRVATASEVSGAVLAIGLWFAIPQRLRLAAGAWVLGIAIVVAGLAPFSFHSAAGAFSWVPFEATFLSDRQSALTTLARKTFDYGAMIWLLRRCGARPFPAALAVAAALLAIEGLQRFLPGRTPEITDLVVALLAGFILLRLEPQRRRPRAGYGIDTTR
jgi:VanZ family protein